MKSAVFLERDGILNRVRSEQNRPKPPLTLEEMELQEESLEPLLALKEAGFLLLVTTNQPGISRGYQLRSELDLMHRRLLHYFPIADILVCSHDEMDDCSCRKPKPGLFQEAAFKWHLDLDRSFVISPHWQDARAAHLLGCTSLLLESPWNGSNHHDIILPDLSRAAQKVLALPGGLRTYQNNVRT